METEALRNWAGNVVFSASELRRPTSVEQLQEIVRDARLVRALGTGHSFSAVADTTGLLVSTADLDLTVEVDPSRSGGGAVAAVPGGWTYAQVATALHEQGWGLPNLGSLPHISVAGACATGTHGSGSELGCLAASAVAVDLVRADGELVHLAAGHPDFRGAVLSLGALGVVTRLWLAVEPTYDVSQEVLLDVPVADAVGHAEQMLASATSVSLFHTFSGRPTLDSVWRKQRTDSPADKAAADWRWGGRPANEPVHPVPGQDPAATTSQLGQPGPWHERLPHFRIEFTPSVGEELQSELLLPREHAGAAIAALEEHREAIAPALQVFEMRTIAGDELWLSPCGGRDSVATHFTWVHDLDDVRPALETVERVLAPFDPRPHWGKVSLAHDAEAVRRSYPRLDDFHDLAQRLDPERCFTSAHLQRLGVR